MSEPPSISDEALALQTQAGSMEAFEELVLRYERRIYSFVSQSCRDGIDAAEITQETFVKAYQAIEQFDPTRTFAPWLFTIARRKCVDHFRALKNVLPLQSSSLNPASDNAAPEMSDTNDPAEALALLDERRHLWNIAGRILPQSQFDALWLHYVEDMSVAQIAKVLRRPQTYIKVLLFRARKVLAARLKPSAAISNSLPESLPQSYEIPVH